METSTTFGAHLRALRQARGLTQQAVADQVDARMRSTQGRSFDVTYLSKIENGRMPPPGMSALLHLADVLGTPRDELLALAGKAPLDLGQLLTTSSEARTFYRQAQQMQLTEAEWGLMQEALEQLRAPERAEA